MSALNEVIKTIDNIDRPGNAFAEATFADAKASASEYDPKSGIWFPSATASAAAGVGHARAEFSIFDAEAKGPNAEAEAEAHIDGVSAFAKAQLGSASVSAGPLKATLGLGVDTGFKVGSAGVEAKVLGTGLSVGPKLEISLLGSGVEFDL